ncbi:hypothetical protein QQP08_006628 [Theobroma cacao]|nr:hypothetical protein QQP08_006628 [Theobroma cacao]
MTSATNLGFRRQKGRKTTNVPKSFLLQILVEDFVTKFVIHEIVTSNVTDYLEAMDRLVTFSSFSTAPKVINGS